MWDCQDYWRVGKDCKVNTSSSPVSWILPKPTRSRWDISKLVTGLSNFFKIRVNLIRIKFIQRRGWVSQWRLLHQCSPVSTTTDGNFYKQELLSIISSLTRRNGVAWEGLGFRVWTILVMPAASTLLVPHGSETCLNISRMPLGSLVFILCRNESCVDEPC